MNRSAFTLIEVLVCVAIITLTMSLLLCGIMAARSASDRITSINNLKQISLAMHQYQQAHTFFAYNSANGSIHYSLLPFLEAQSLHDNYNPNLLWYQVSNLALGVLGPKVFTSPYGAHQPGESDYSLNGGCSQVVEYDPLAPVEFGIDQFVLYYNCCGINPYFANGFQPQNFQTRPLRPEDVLDELGNTVMFVGNNVGKLTESYWGNTEEFRPGIAYQALVATWDNPMYGVVSLDPNQMGGRYGGAYGPMAFGDGSVHWVDPNVDPTVLRALSTIAGREIVNQTDY
jgi:prepilin-type N-terminal cleavage/methylation domain-containing protein